MAEAEFLDRDLYEEVPLETLLIKRKLLTIDQINYAKSLYYKQGERIEHILIREGLIQSEDLYKTLAEYFNSKYVDIKKYPCDKTILNEDNFHKYSKYLFVPWRKVGQIVLVAITSMNDELFLYLKQTYPNGFRVIFSTPKNIISNIQRKCSNYTMSLVKEELKIVDPVYSSHKLMRKRHKFIMAAFLVLSVFAITFSESFSFKFILITANIFFFLNTIFKSILFLYSKDPEEDSSYKNYKEKDLPTYTILLPLYKEGLVIRKLLKSMRSLHYPKSKLDIILIVEQFDRETIKFLNKENYDDLFRVICIPKSNPKTKPKACSYALKFAHGEYITIYDAEDRPDPNQLLKAVHEFKKGGPNLACLQAKLNCFNFKESLVAFLFSVEYLIWFGCFLRGLEKLNIPIPLGGNSNHFKTQILKHVGGWDPYNVTEDADLGYRLAKKGYKTKMLNSITWEEAPADIKSWMNQRSRWIKGHIQTYVVHLRDIFRLKRNFGFMGILGFHGFLMLPIMSYFLQLFVLGYGVFGASGEKDILLREASIGNFILWIVLSIGLGAFAILKNKWKGIKIVYVLFYPFYYFLHLISAIIALYQLVFAPHYWSKTSHKFDERMLNKKI